MADSAVESAMSYDTFSPRVDPLPQQERGSQAWDRSSQLQQTRQWEADGMQLRRPVNVQAWAYADAALQ